jgi:hypothetical protein
MLIRSEDSDAEVFIEPPSSWDEAVPMFDVKVNASGLRASAGVVTFPQDDLALFFAGLADDWRGWEGRRTWRSVEGDLTLNATHQGRVLFEIGLSQPYTPVGWTVAVAVEVNAGEELARLATEAAALLEQPSHGRALLPDQGPELIRLDPESEASYELMTAIIAEEIGVRVALGDKDVDRASWVWRVAELSADELLMKFVVRPRAATNPRYRWSSAPDD